MGKLGFNRQNYKEPEIKIAGSFINYVKGCKFLRGFTHHVLINSCNYVEMIAEYLDTNPAITPTIVQMTHTTSMKAMNSISELWEKAGYMCFELINKNDAQTYEELDKAIVEGYKNIVLIAMKKIVKRFDPPVFNRLLICGTRSSIVETMQLMNQILWDHKYKKDIQPEIYHMISKVNLKKTDLENTKKTFLRITKVINTILTANMFYNTDVKKDKVYRDLINRATPIELYETFAEIDHKLLTFEVNKNNAKKQEITIKEFLKKKISCLTDQ